MSIDTANIADYYESEEHWQEYDCPECKGDFDVSPIPRPSAKLSCIHCGTPLTVGESCNTYTSGADGFAMVIDYPQRG